MPPESHDGRDSQAGRAPASDHDAQVVERPVFIVGAERSGSTMLWLMLDSHPSVAMCGQMEYAVEFDLADGWPDPEPYEAFLKQDSMFLTSGFSADMSLPYPDMMRSILHQRLADTPADFVGAAVHKNFHQLRLLWPEARFIHLVRDGRDVANSFVGRGWVGHPYFAAPAWVECEQTWDKLKAELDADAYLEVRYEELVRDPETVMDEVCSFIGVPYDEAMYSYSDGSDYERPRGDLAEQWRHSMSPRTIDQLETELGPMLEARGYERTTTGRRQIGKLEQVTLRSQDAVARFRDRIDRFGPKLTFKQYATRLPGLGAQRQAVREEVAAARMAQRKRHWSDDASTQLR